MLLLVDVGNTQIELGVFDEASSGGSYVAKWRLSTVPQQSADDLISRILPLFGNARISPTDIDEMAMACVVPSLTTSLQHLSKKLFGIDAVLCTIETVKGTGLFETDYPHPHEIGSDRIADAIGARSLYGGPCVVIDFGTATNIEVLDDKGAFIGGIIAPGLMTGANALFSNAAQIAAIGVSEPESVIGKSTAQALQSGVIYGEVGRVDGLLDRIFDELGGPCNVAVTGGLCHTVSRLLRHVTDVRPELTLDGLRILAQTLKEKN